MKKFANMPSFSKRVKAIVYKDYLNLIEILQRHAHLYYTEDSPEISDYEYDKMLRLLIEVEKENPNWQVNDSPSLKIGGEIKGEFSKVPHEPLMMSLDNASNWGELLAFDQRVKKQLKTEEEQIYHAEPKFDGLGVELIYEEGVLQVGSTRGNGKTGEDITHNIRTIRNIPLRLMLKYPPQYISIRGECILPNSAFAKINQEMKDNHQKLYANPRNVASGTLRQKDSRATAKRGIKFFPYSIGKVIESKQSLSLNPSPLQQKELYTDYLPKLGFAISKMTQHGFLSSISGLYKQLCKVRSQLDFDIDGLVIKLNDFSQWGRLGATSKAPRYAIALKFSSRSAFTKIKDVVFQVGRTGVITPIAQLSPINIGGVVVKRANLHNESEIKKLAIQINDLVEVERAGDVIPKIIRREEKAPNRQAIFFPRECPSCQGKIVKEKTYQKCENSSCEEKNIATIKYIVSKNNLDIEGLGQEWIAKFYQKKLICNIADIFTLKISDIETLEGMGDILPQKIISAINSKRKVKYSIFVRSLGIPNVGSQLAEVITKEFSPIEVLMGASKEEIQNIHTAGEAVADSIVTYFLSYDNQKILTRLFASDFEIDYSNNIHENIVSVFFYNKSFVFTGRLNQMTRSQAQEKILEMGGKVTSSVSSKTDYLVSGEEGGSKRKKAEELGISILTEEDFQKELERTFIV